MTAEDCFNLAVELYHNKNYNESLLWLEEASDLLDQEDISSQLNTNIKIYKAMNHLEDGITF